MKKKLFAWSLCWVRSKTQHDANLIGYIHMVSGPTTICLRQLVIVLVVVFMAISSAQAGVSSSGKAGFKASPAKQVYTVGSAATTSTIAFPNGKASASGILVRFKQTQISKLTSAAALVQNNLKISHEYTSVPGLKRLAPATHSISNQSITNQSLLATIKSLKATGQFDYVEPDWQVHVLTTPTDSAFVNGELWGLRNTGQNGGVAGIDVNVVPAWDIITGLPTVVVGVIDSGIRYTHQDIASNMWINSGEIAGNSTDDDANGYVDDVFGINAITGSGDPFDDNNHGTHVAGSIAATAFDSGQHVGVAYNVRLMALKFLDSTGAGFTSDAIELIDYAISHGVDILNNSWGGGGYSQALRDSIQAANDAGILFLAAAGNSASDNDLTPHYPSDYDIPNVIAVAAVDRSGNLAGFSNYGATTVDIAAPGVEIFSSTADSDSSYDTYNGTSMATPHVSGVAALMVSNYPSAGIIELKNRLLLTTKPLASLSGRVVSGGIVDAHASLTIEGDGNLELAASADGFLDAGQSNNISITVTDLLPVSGATVTGGFDGEPTQSFHDNGLSPDTVVDDGVYAATLVVPIGVASVNLNIQVTAPGKNPVSESFPFPVVSSPDNDDFVDRIVLVSGTTQTTGTNQNASSETDEPHNPMVAGGKTVWWEWTAPTSGPVTISTTGSSYDTTLAIYQGTSLGSLSLIGENDDSSGLQSAVTFLASSGETYLVQVDGYAGSEGNIELNYPSPGGTIGAPIIETQPVGRSIIVGDPFNISVTATGQQPLTYQWFLEGVAISGATGSSYSVASSTQLNGGNYTVEISNVIGSVISNPAYVAIDTVGLLPDNDLFINADLLSGTTGQVSGMNIRATGETGEPDHAGLSTPLASVWYKWTAPSNGTLDLDTLGSDYDTTLAVYSGASVSSLTEIISNDDNGGLQSAVSFLVVAGETYLIAVDGYSSSEGQLILNYAFSPDVAIGTPNDNFVDRIVMSGSNPVIGSTVGATGETGEPNHAGVSLPLSSVWWLWTAPDDGEVTISTMDSDFDTTLAVYTGSSVDSVTEITSNDDFSGLQSQVSFAVSAGFTYAIAVDGHGASEGTVELVVNFVAESPPLDSDGDGVPDISDNCPTFPNIDQSDFDNDGIGDACDLDDDNDSVSDGEDAFPLDPNESVDTDLDGIGNNTDLDDDNDGVLDGEDAFPLDPNESVDTDLDGIGNNTDLDDDNDGVLDGEDAFPLDPNESVDTDLDGIGNNADLDDDNDGMSDDSENQYGFNPLDPIDADMDANGNGISNLEEIIAGTNPLAVPSNSSGGGGSLDLYILGFFISSVFLNRRRRLPIVSMLR